MSGAETCLEDLDPIRHLLEGGECMAVKIGPADLHLVIYVINSGILRIKEQSNYKALDLHDKEAIRFGQSMLDGLLKTFRSKSRK